MAQFRENDFIICKPAEEKRTKANVDFEIYARIVKIDESTNTAFLDKYLEQGLLHCETGKDIDGNEVYNKFPLNEIDRFYQLMNNEEKHIFRDNLQKIKDRTVKDPWKSIRMYSSKVKATYEAVCNEINE